MKKVSLLLLPMFMIFFVSCSSMKSFEKAPAASMTPEVRLNIGLDDIEYLGETTISVTTRKYFGCAKRIDKVNGKPFDRHNCASVSMMGNVNIPLQGDLKWAADKVINEFPTADYFAPAFYKNEVADLFMGKISTQTMVVKAYKYKSK
ncbi:MAG: hypothetical protein J6P73_00300 [Bacteroidales bacterium]|nr:hypothetical protein [Bacteroidales bacterium]